MAASLACVLTLRKTPKLFNPALNSNNILQLSVRLFNSQDPNAIGKWRKYNKILYPPLKPGQKPRPAEITHYRKDIKYSPDKMWYIACMIRGMSIDEALKQLSFHKQKGCTDVKEVLLEAQEMAVSNHNVEFKSNLWIADSLVGEGKREKGMRYHSRGRAYPLKLRYVNYFVRLREGKPPKHYYPPPQTGNEKLEEYIKEMRSRRIINGL